MAQDWITTTEAVTLSGYHSLTIRNLTQVWQSERQKVGATSGR